MRAAPVGAPVPHEQQGWICLRKIGNGSAGRAPASIRSMNRPDVLEAVRHFGVDVDRMNASVATLAGHDLERTASVARQVNETLAGGASSVVISTTTIIIALLVVILIIVAVK